jgi:hypothetical protein
MDLRDCLSATGSPQHQETPSSARGGIVGGIAIPSTFAVFRFTIEKNRVGYSWVCKDVASSGRSDSAAPRNAGVAAARVARFHI